MPKNGEVEIEGVTYDAPILGYKSVINMGLHISRQMDGSVEIFDDGISFDLRSCTFVFELNEAQHILFIDEFAEISKSRGQDFTLKLSAGFYPFGPDFGDRGDFVCKMIETKELGIGETPFLFFHTEVTFAYVSGPTRTFPLPAGISEGQLNVAGILNLRFPPAWFKPEVNHNITTVVSRDGTVHSQDKSELADNFDTNFILLMGPENCARLVNALTVTVRKATYEILSRDNYFPLGIQKGDNKTFTVKPLTNKLEITHTRIDEFSMPLSATFVSSV